MASAVIHIAVANEINNTLKRNKKDILVGSIAPDIAKLVGETKVKGHFLTEKRNDIPDLESFLKKYKNNLDDDFVLGYYIHLYTDYLWFKYFITEVLDKNVITKLNGEKINCTQNMISMYIYNDYTNLNIQLIDKYNLDLKIFYEPTPSFNNIIEEIPMDKIDIVINKMGNIIANSKEYKDFIFNMEHIENFIAFSSKIILANILELKSNS